MMLCETRLQSTLCYNGQPLWASKREGIGKGHHTFLAEQVMMAVRRTSCQRARTEQAAHARVTLNGL